jgi:uncharacterized membrane protein
MLSPSARRRWFFGLTDALKIIFVAALLGAIIKYFPSEVLPFVTGLLLYVAAILTEAARLMVAPRGSGGGR